MNYTEKEVLQFVEENDVKFIRLTFCDIFGTIKNISIMASELPRAFKEGISFDASAVKGFMNVSESDLLLVPDATTLAVLPWRPQQGRVARFYCNIKHPNGDDFEGDGRLILKKAVEVATKKGISFQIGTECEFYLFEADEKGFPTKIPHDQGSYCDIAPADLGENVRRDICLTLEQMGIMPESSHHEQGPGQNEIDFKYSSPLNAADNLLTFKSVVKNIAARNGLYASFMPKPFANKSGSGLHINISLLKNGVNLFAGANNSFSPESASFIAGVLNRTADMTAFFNSTTNSYQRLCKSEAPGFITWSHQNRAQLVRIPTAKGEYRRMELRSPDPACNPYLVLALIIYAGLEGIDSDLKLCPPWNHHLIDADFSEVGIDRLPETLGKAVKVAENSDFISKVLPEEIVRTFILEKKSEWKEYENSDDKDLFESNRYFASL